MGKKGIYVIDILAYFVLSVVTAIYSYSGLEYIETIENEYNVYGIFAFDVTREFVGYAIMAIATIFLMYFIYRANKSFSKQTIGKIVFKEIMLLLIIFILVGLYAIEPYILMVSAPDQVIFTNHLSEVLKKLIYIVPFVFYILMMIYMIIIKIKER